MKFGFNILFFILIYYIIQIIIIKKIYFNCIFCFIIIKNYNLKSFKNNISKAPIQNFYILNYIAIYVKKVKTKIG